MKLISFKAYEVFNQFNFNIDFNPDVSILHGFNGCGKTTVLKLINYIIGGKFFELKKIQFKNIILNYRIKGKEYKIEVYNENGIKINSNHEEIKNAISKINFNKISRRVADNEKKILNLMKIFDEVFNAIFLSIERKVQKVKPYPFYDDPGFIEFLEEFVPYSDSYKEEELHKYYRIYEREFSHRFPKRRRTSIKDIYINPIEDVDELIAQNYKKYLKFCSELDTEYQQNSYKRMVSLKKLNEVEDKLLEFDQNSMRKAKERIFNQINYFKDKFEIPEEEDFENLIKNLENQKENVKKKKNMASDYLLNFIQFLKLDELAIILEGNNFKKEKKYEPFRLLIENLDNFFSVTNKNAIFDNDSIAFQLKNGEKIKPNDLSSGEKQILIFFSHLIFNEHDKMEPIILYDEPELSLHLDWQEKFIESIFKINETIQIILATHSPAVISEEFQNRQISLEDSLIL